MRVFRNRSLAAGSVGLLVTFAIIMGLFLVSVQFMQAVFGYSAIRGALGLMPMAVVMMPLSAIAPGLTERFGLRVMLTAGNLSVAIGLALTAILGSADGGYWPVLPGILVLGLGMGLSMSPGTTAITASPPEEKQGVAAALNDTVREFDGATGGRRCEGRHRRGIHRGPDARREWSGCARVGTTSLRRRLAVVAVDRRRHRGGRCRVHRGVDLPPPAQ